jgi:hypothetical protein
VYARATGVFPVAQQDRSQVAHAEPHPPASRIEAEVLRSRALMEKRQFGASLAAAEALLPEVPENRDVLYLIAVNQRSADIGTPGAGASGLWPVVPGARALSEGGGSN